MWLGICLKEMEERVHSSPEGVYNNRESSDLKTVKGHSTLHIKPKMFQIRLIADITLKGQDN